MVFEDRASIPKALLFSGQTLGAHPVYVTVTQNERNQIANSGLGSGPLTQLMIYQLHQTITEDDLKELFSPFGQLVQVSTPNSPESQCAVVLFEKPEDAKNAHQKMNGFALTGKALRIMLTPGPIPAADSSSKLSFS